MNYWPLAEVHALLSSFLANHLQNVRRTGATNQNVYNPILLSFFSHLVQMAGAKSKSFVVFFFLQRQNGAKIKKFNT